MYVMSNRTMKSTTRFFLEEVVIALVVFSSVQLCFAETRKPQLLDFKYNINSQCGEDGVIQKIFEIIGTTTKRCIEFGAWDGIYLSNTANLYMNYGWHATLIEISPIKYEALVKNVEPKCPSCVLLNRGVGLGDESLDQLLKQQNMVDWKFDLLSIDIDGNDYYIFESLQIVRPRVVLVEYNPTLPAHLDILYPYDPENHMGCSVAALVRVGASKGYRLAALTEVNAVFVVEEEFHKLAAFETSLEKIKVDYAVSYLVTDYLGRYAVVSKKDFVFPYGLTVPMKDTIVGVNISYYQIQLQL